MAGTTSAYAEKSAESKLQTSQHRNYLRIRGEKRVWRTDGDDEAELPPHTRRKDLETLIDQLITGTTSAYAEKSRG
ncbi:Uncharacterised protein [Corynebacterium ulcerans]|uniref:Uncharacterized protein n=1 Tax=Corynebacterium ulcerans TaxID=65058 RepID=A0ABD7MUQ4_CORUL|nr:Uncharacterised protein [Corynebacterium ulcerans]